MRLFVGIFLAPDVINGLVLSLAELQKNLKHDIVWFSPISWHIVLKVIGEWPDDRLGDLEKILTQLPTLAPIPVSIERIRWSPDFRYLWASVEPNVPLRHLAQTIDRSLLAVGVPQEESTDDPHIALALEKIEPARGHLPRDISSIVQPKSFAHFTANGIDLCVVESGKYRTLATRLQDLSFSLLLHIPFRHD